MNWTREELKTQAKGLLKRRYLVPFFVSFVSIVLSTEFTYNIIDGGLQVGIGKLWNTTFYIDSFSTSFMPFDSMWTLKAGMFILLATIIGILVRIFLLNPLEVGKKYFYLNEAAQEGKFTDLFQVFQMKGYLNVVKILFLRDLKIVLWTLLFIIPGIYKTYEYFMVGWILAEDSTIPSKEVFALSKKMMENNKFKTIVLNLSFIGWIILGALLFGIGMYFVNPYIDATQLFLYIRLKEEKLDVYDVKEAIV